MQERTVSIATKVRGMETFVAHPSGSGPYLAVVMYMNIGGLSDIMKGMARRVAESGYYCIVPDLYYRLGKLVSHPDNRDPDALAIRSLAHKSIRDSRLIMDDTRAVLDFIDGDPFVRRGPIGCIGYCMGGRMAPIAAATFPDRIKATASMFPSRLMDDVEDSPHLTLDRITGEIYFGLADNDKGLSLDAVEEWRGRMAASCSARYEIDVHPDTEHGFAFPGRLVYQRDAAERAWTKTFAMFKRQLA